MKLTNALEADGNAITGLPAAADPTSPVTLADLLARLAEPCLVSELPTAASELEGARGFVTDADANTFNTVAAGSGANKVPVFCTGSDWRIG